MSTEEASGGGDEPRITVEDPDDYNLSRRYQQIHRAREYVVQIRREAGREASRGEMSLGRFREELAQAVVDFARELKWLAEGEEDVEAVRNEIWDEVEIDAPRHPDGKIVGIGDFVDRYGLIEVQETVEYDSPFAGGQNQGTRESMDAPSVETTMRIYDQCLRFMKEIGLDVRMKGETPGPEANPVDPAGRFDE